MCSFSNYTIYYVVHNSILHIAIQPVPVRHVEVFCADIFLFSDCFVLLLLLLFCNVFSVLSMYHSHIDNGEVI